LHSHRSSAPPMPQNTLPTESNAHINTHNQVHNLKGNNLRIYINLQGSGTLTLLLI
jgi:hypothetical protein